MIGATTSGAAKNKAMLDAAEVTVVLVEEAGEIDIEISSSVKTEVLQPTSEDGEIDENAVKADDVFFDCHICTKSCRSQ